MDVADGRLTPEEIGLGFVPRRRPATAEVRVGDELVVAVAPFEPCHLLNSTAALVWERLDGAVDLAAVIDDLAKAAGLDADAIGPDVVELARHLGRVGLLEGVTSGTGGPADQTPPAGPPAGEGDLLEDFAFAEAAGRPGAWSSFRGRTVLLLNWSPFCGYCLQIANGLGDLRPGLADRDIELVLVTLGGTDENQPVLDKAGMGDVTVLYNSKERDPFAGLGTPAAYLVGGDGRVAAPLAYGAREVPQFVARLAGVEPAAAAGDDDIRYLSGGGGVCAPSNGSGRDRSTDWAGVAAYAMGEFRVGLRYNTEETAAWLDRLFPGARVEDPKVPDNYSCALYPSSGGRARELNLLVWSGLQVVRSRSAARVLRALLGHLSAELHHPDPDLLQADGVAVLRSDGEALVLPSVLYNSWSAVQPRLNRLGLQIVDRPLVSIDTAKAQIVVAEPVIAHDRAVLEVVDLGARVGDEPPAVSPGRYPLRTWILPTEDRPVGPLSKAAAIARAGGLLPRAPVLRAALDQLVELFSQTEAYAVRYQGPQEFCKQVGSFLA